MTWRDARSWKNTLHSVATSCEMCLLDWWQWIQITCVHGAGDGPLINEWKQLGALASLTIRVGNGTRVGLTADLIQPLTLACSGPCWDFFAALFHSTWGNLCLFFSQVDRPQKSPVREATCIRAAIIICESVTQLPNGRTPAGFLLFIPRRSTCLLSNTFPVDIHSVCLYFYVGLGWFVSILLPLQPKESSFTTDFYFICLFFSYDWHGWWYYEQMLQLPLISVSI